MLGIEPDATEGEIRAAYKRLALKWHPDLNRSKGAGERMAEINAAFDAMTGKGPYEPPSPGGAGAGPGAPPPPPTYAGGMTEDELRHTIVACERCGRSDTTLRVSVMVTVRSFIGTWRRGSAELLCEYCRGRAALAANAQSALLGWWGWAGIVLTPLETVRNARGGRQVREVNDEILLALAQTRGARGDAEGREEALGERLAVHQSPDGIAARGRLKTGASALSVLPTLFGGLVIAGAITALVLTAGPTRAEVGGSIEATRAVLQGAGEALDKLPTEASERCATGWSAEAADAYAKGQALQRPTDPLGAAAVDAARRAAGSVNSTVNFVCPQLPLSAGASTSGVNSRLEVTTDTYNDGVAALNRWVTDYNGGRGG